MEQPGTMRQADLRIWLCHFLVWNWGQGGLSPLFNFNLLIFYLNFCDIWKVLDIDYYFILTVF